MAKCTKVTDQFKGTTKIRMQKSFESLPENVFTHILSYLSREFLVRCSIVNSRWHRLCFDASLWRDVCIPFDYRHNVVDSTVMKLSVCSRNVSRVNLVECRQVTDDLLVHIAMHCQNLQKLQLCGCIKISDTGMMNVAQRCTKLTKIGVIHTKVTDLSLNILIQNNPCLKTLEASSQACTLETFKSLRNCGSLKKLRVFEASEEVFVKDPNLELILNNDMIGAIARSCPKLTDLILLYDYANVTDSSVYELAQGCRWLKILEIESSPRLGDPGVKALTENGHLQHLYLGESRVTDETLRAVAKHLPFIRALKLEHADVTDQGVFDLMKECKYIEELSLGVKIPENLTDIAISFISCLSGPLICSLTFASCSITDRGLAVLVSNPIPLTSLTIKSCPYVTFEGLMKCLKRCQGLIDLDVSFSGLLENAKQLMEIAQILPNLSSLRATDVDGVTGKDLETFKLLYPDCDICL